MGLALIFALTVAFCVVFGIAVAGIFKIIELLQSPSVDHVERRANEPLSHIGDDSAITIWGFYQPGEHVNWKDGISDDSPFCSRVEAYLRLTKQPYIKKASQGGASENPRRKVPFANLYGQMVNDSTRILDALKNMIPTKLDDRLTNEQLIMGHLIQRMLHDSLYFVMLHQRFFTRHGRRIFAEGMAKHVPPFISTILVNVVVQRNYINMYGSGIGRCPHAEIVKRGEQDVQILAKILDQNKYLFGDDQATSFDCDVYAFLVSLFYDVALQETWIDDLKRKHPNLVGYVSRMRQHLYPELV